MKTCMITFLVFILSSSQLWAECGNTPDLELNPKAGTEYAHSKTIYHSIDGKIKSSDSLIVWKKDSKKLCFSITTVSNEYSTCYLDGEASAVGNNEYVFKKNECRVSLIFIGDKIKLNVTGSRGKFCVADDLGEDNGCGMNTSIDLATYTKVKKKSP